MLTSPAELIALFNALLCFLGHEIDTRLLSERLRSISLEVRHLFDTFLVSPIQTVRVEYFPAISLLRLFIALSFLATKLLLCLNGCLKQVHLVFVDSFGLQVSLGESLL